MPDNTPLLVLVTLFVQTPKAVVAARLGMIDDLLAALKTRKASQADACAALIAGMHKGQARIIRPVAPYCSRETLGRALVTAATHGKVGTRWFCASLSRRSLTFDAV